MESCRVERQVDHSVLTAVRQDGADYRFPPGSRVTLWAGGSVLFMGRAVADDRVLDLMSAESNGELHTDELI